MLGKCMRADIYSQLVQSELVIFTYIKCQCMASMKKIFYVVDIKLRNACGSIEETHCECAVGSGHEAHCKHVLVALYGIAHMVNFHNYKHSIAAFR
ncbi:hypothetical protein HW555_007877 [Spodoptera exigua]|uniref:SWIM-type domain-containing protein n=1 Tax=Spodoptera exigua TaxID=7107 RepID=A0A835GC50_SPOEX|nr:hypothetical protein HW555_007877 [Spodoptera exigua]